MFFLPSVTLPKGKSKNICSYIHLQTGDDCDSIIYNLILFLQPLTNRREKLGDTLYVYVYVHVCFCVLVCVCPKGISRRSEKINQNRFKSTTSVADLPMSVCARVCACVCGWMFAIGLVGVCMGVCIVKMLPIYLFLCPRVCFIASAFVAVIVALLPSSESISHFHPFSLPSKSKKKNKRGITLHAPVFCFHTHIWSIFNNGIEAQAPTHPHTYISRHWTHLQLDFCVFF